ncbi:MAG: putative glycoside hydrolase, partial [Gaiellaceae bacterium]
MNAWDYAMIPALKQANPNVKVLEYKDMASTRSYASGDAEIPAGIDYGWADANHPDWFTHKNGARIQWDGFAGHYQMNIGMSGYQNQWATNVISDLGTHGWDGVMVDNANMNPNGYASLPYDEYPTQQSYQAATRSFLANVGPKIQSAGFLIIPNIQHDGTFLTESLWKDWIQFASGAH